MVNLRSFPQAAFISDDNDIDMDDPEFWTKILPELEQKGACQTGLNIHRDIYIYNHKSTTIRTDI